MSIAADIAAQVARVEAVVSCPVTADPRAALNERDVVVLVDPPTRDYNARLQTWTLVVLRVTSDVGLDTTEALSAVVEELEASEVPIESATPAARRLGPERPPVPVYLVRYTTP